MFALSDEEAGVGVLQIMKSYPSQAGYSQGRIKISFDNIVITFLKSFPEDG